MVIKMSIGNQLKRLCNENKGLARSRLMFGQVFTELIHYTAAFNERVFFMAQKARVIKVQLQLADMQRHYYQDHNLTLAQHPSETDERLMVRILAFALNASEQLAFAKNLSDEGEPELAEYNLHGDIELWIAFGQLDEKWLRKASQKAKQVKVYTYGGRSVPIWWQQNQSRLQRFNNLQIWEIPEANVREAAGLMARSLQLQCNISEDQVLLSDQSQSISVEPVLLKDFT